MSDPLDRFLDHHHTRLGAIAKRLDEFKTRVGDDREGTKASIDQELDLQEAAVGRVKDDAAAAQARMTTLRAIAARRDVDTAVRSEDERRNDAGSIHT